MWSKAVKCGGLISSCCSRNPHRKAGNEARRRRKRYCSRSAFYLLQIFKSCPKPYPIFPLFAQMDLIYLTPHHWQSYVSNLRDIRKRWLCKNLFQNKQQDVRLYSNIAFLILPKTLQRHPCLMSRKFAMPNCWWNTELNGFDLFSRIRGIVEQGLKLFFITSVVLISSIKSISSNISFKLFNKTNIIRLGQNWILTVYKCGIAENSNSADFRSFITFHWISVQS